MVHHTYLFKVNQNLDEAWEVFDDYYLSWLAIDDAFKPESFLSEICSLLLPFIEEYGDWDYEGKDNPPIFSEVQVSPPELISKMISWTYKSRAQIKREDNERIAIANRIISEYLIDDYILGAVNLILRSN